MKKDLLITLLLAITLVVGVTILNNEKVEKEEPYFFIDTPIDSYSPLMSNVKGFPFSVKCNNEQTIIIEITSGILQDENGVLKENKVSCNKTIYWNEKEAVSQVKIKFISTDEVSKKQEFMLLKNENQEFYLSR